MNLEPEVVSLLSQLNHQGPKKRKMKEPKKDKHIYTKVLQKQINESRQHLPFQMGLVILTVVAIECTCAIGNRRGDVVAGPESKGPKVEGFGSVDCGVNGQFVLIYVGAASWPPYKV